VVVGGIAVELQPRRPIFEKSYHLREKGGVLMLFFKPTPHLGAKALYIAFELPCWTRCVVFTIVDTSHQAVKTASLTRHSFHASRELMIRLRASKSGGSVSLSTKFSTKKSIFNEKKIKIGI
jgi:hypothetical protein